MKKKVGSLKVTYQQDRYIKEVLVGKEYDFMSYYPIVIDIGANIGTFSLSMLNRAERIYALEPAEENFNCLTETIQDNNITKIMPFKMAIGDKSFVQNMDRLGDAGMGGWKLSESGDYPVDCRTLKDFMDSQNIAYADLVKIDVEGYEDKIFRTPYFPKDRIGTIIGEYHVGSSIREPLEWLGFKYIDVSNSHFIARKI